MERPTATHTGATGHDTPASEALSAPAGFGADCSPHAFTRPYQRVTNGEPSDSDSPTAVHVRFRGHETLFSWVAPAGFGVG